jgi:polyphosphate glucokinase
VGDQLPERSAITAFDVGATSISAGTVGRDRRMLSGVAKRRTRPPLGPEQLVEAIGVLARRLPRTELAVVGFPGLVEDGAVISPENLVAVDGPGSASDRICEEAWIGYPLQTRLAEHLERAVLLFNDADVAALGCARGEGRELTVTLGSGVGTGLVVDGRLQPHQEHPRLSVFDGQLVDAMVGEQARKGLAHGAWEERVLGMLVELRSLTSWDRCYVAGGNARRLSRDRMAELEADLWAVYEPVGLLGAAGLVAQAEIGTNGQ